MKSLKGNAVLLGLAVATASVVGCSSSPSSPSASNGQSNVAANSGETGSLSMKLSLGGETEIDSVNYTLQNGSAVVQSGVLATNHSNAINFQLGTIAAGSGYTVTLTAASPDGGVSCMGTSQPFAVTAHATVQEQVQLICTFGTSATGNAQIIGLESFCGTWQSVSTIGPGVDAGATNGSEVFADGTTPIVITATGNGADTGALVYTYSVLSSTGGGVTLGAETGNGTTTSTQTVTCNGSTQNGTAVIQLVVTDSQDGGAVTCPTTLSTTTVNVACDGVANCPTGTTKCNGACVNTTSDNNNCGTCGTVCSGGEVCSGSACACPTGDTLCGSTCANTQTDANNCGSCGKACPSGQSCVAGACSTVCTGTADECACNTFVTAHEVGNVPTAGVCSPTEVAAWDVDQTGACLDCLLNAGQCLDNPALGTSGNDCEDAFTGAGAGETAAECTAVLDCDLGVTPAAVPAPVTATGPGPVQGYCGTTPVPACESGSTPANGACKSQIVAGFPSTFGSAQIGGNIAAGTYASGRAGAIAACAQNSCTACLAGSTL